MSDKILLEDLLIAGPFSLPDLPLKPSAWIGHVPFAQWLVGVLRPRILVELGVHHGISYLGFCQAVLNTAAGTRCFGIDHWEGDFHTGTYQSGVLTELRKFHDHRYARFSQLVQSSFGQAVSTFEDGSIDLLHIDGYHTYESVKNDFETWKPKLSDRAIVLFHDTEVRERNFGVYQFWHELKAQHPFFEFHHSSGLGVLGYGSAMPEVLRRLFLLDQDAASVRMHFKRHADYLNHLHSLAITCEVMRSSRSWRLTAPLRTSIRILHGAKLSLKSKIKALLNLKSKTKTLLLDKGPADPLIPPDKYHSVGGGDPDGLGNEFLGHMIEMGGLTPDARILDIGAGTGRMARPLTRYLDQGSYSGLEITPSAVAWCKKAYKNHPNFSFTHVDIHNKHYNATGKLRASDCRFPFADESFDFVLLTSVFTHMLPQDVDNYVSEINRVLRKGGCCLATFFLLNGESLMNLSVGLGMIEFTHPIDELSGCLSYLKDNPEFAIAYPESHVRRLFSRHGLTLDEPVCLGSWCGRSQFRSLQDIIVARKA